MVGIVPLNGWYITLTQIHTPFDYEEFMANQYNQTDHRKGFYNNKNCQRKQCTLLI